MSRFDPVAFRHAEAVRGVGLGVLRGMGTVTGLLLAAFALAVQVAAGLAGGNVLPVLAAAVLVGGALAAYAVVVPGWFLRASRATTGPGAARLLAAAVAGHVAGWALLLVAVRL